jgi:hypothetical protein
MEPRGFRRHAPTRIDRSQLSSTIRHGIHYEADLIGHLSHEPTNYQPPSRAAEQPALPALPTSGGSGFASASTLATSSSRNTTSLATASMSRRAWKHWPSCRAAAAAAPERSARSTASTALGRKGLRRLAIVEHNLGRRHARNQAKGRVNRFASQIGYDAKPQEEGGLVRPEAPCGEPVRQAPAC